MTLEEKVPRAHDADAVDVRVVGTLPHDHDLLVVVSYRLQRGDLSPPWSRLRTSRQSPARRACARPSSRQSRPHRLLLALRGRREGRSPGESLEAIQPGLAKRGIITRTGPLYGRAYLTEQRTTSHSDTRPSLCFTRFYCSLFAIAWSISLLSAARCSAELMPPTIGSPTMLPF